MEQHASWTNVAARLRINAPSPLPPLCLSFDSPALSCPGPWLPAVVGCCCSEFELVMDNRGSSCYPASSTTYTAKPKDVYSLREQPVGRDWLMTCPVLDPLTWCELHSWKTEHADDKYMSITCYGGYPTSYLAGIDPYEERLLGLGQGHLYRKLYAVFYCPGGFIMSRCACFRLLVWLIFWFSFPFISCQAEIPWLAPE